MKTSFHQEIERPVSHDEVAFTITHYNLNNLQNTRQMPAVKDQRRQVGFRKKEVHVIFFGILKAFCILNILKGIKQ